MLLADPNRVLQASGRIDVPFKNAAALAADELTGEWVSSLETRIVLPDVLFLCPLLNESTNRFKILLLISLHEVASGIFSDFGCDNKNSFNITFFNC